MEFKKVKVDVEGGVATLTLNHPEVMNAISIDVLEGLGEALDFVEDKANGVRCVVLTGAGKGFCAGANLQGRNTGDASARARSSRATIIRCCGASVVCTARSLRPSTVWRRARA